MTRSRILALVLSMVTARTGAAKDIVFLDLVPEHLPTFHHASTVVGLNLVNRLYLSRSQLAGYVRFLEDRVRIERELQATLRGTGGPFRAALVELEAVLARGEMPGEDLVKRVQAAEDGALIPLRHAQVKVRDLAAELEKTLTSNQRDMIRDYQPCIIPREDQRAPDRIGSTPVSSDMIDGAEKIRALNSLVYWVARDRIALKIAQDFHGKFPSAPEEAVKKRLVEAFDGIRSKSEFEWKTGREEIVRGIHDDLVAIAGIAPPAMELASSIMEHMLNPGLLPILKQRLEHPRELPAAAPAPLPETAETCPSSRCGERE